MTRDEAKDFMWYENDKNPRINWGNHETIRGLIDEMIDKIYDDFESRTCGGCKYLEDGDCGLIEDWDFYNDEPCKWSPPNNFCCNKWIAK